MKSTILLLLIITSSMFAFAQNELKTEQSKHCKLEIWTYGLPVQDYQNIRNEVAQAYGFCYKAVAGCVVNDKILNETKTHNDIVYAKLEELHGKNWQEKYDEEVASKMKAIKANK